MKKVEKRKLNKNLLQLVILGATLLVLIGALVTVQLLPPKETEKEQVKLPEIREELGEALYLNVPLAYPIIQENQLDYIVVENKDKEGNPRAFAVSALGNGSYVLEYSKDGTTETLTPYLPSIIGAEGNFDLASLYARETGTGLGQVYLLTYLCSAVGTPTFTERIDLPENTPENKAERDAILIRYGFDSATRSSIRFTYYDADKELQGHTVILGARSLSGAGFYYMVDGRNVVYYTTSNSFEYALRGFEDFVNGRLVAEGLKYDYTFEPALTSKFEQWVNTQHKTEGEVITAKSAVIATGTAALPLTAGSDYTPEGKEVIENGYLLSDKMTFSFSPEELSWHSDYVRFNAVLTGNKVGKYTEPLYLTLIDELGVSSAGLISFGEAESISYSYVLTAVESVITATDEIRDTASLTQNGAPVSYNLVKVTYDLYVGGEKKNTRPLHAVMDLSSAVLAPSDAEKIRNEIDTNGIGDIPSPITVNIEYSRENAVTTTESLYIDSIIAIYSHAGDPLTKVGDDSYVTISYYEVVDGHRTDLRTVSLDLAAQDDSGRWNDLREKLKGQKIGEYPGTESDKRLYTKTYCYEVMRGFSEYRIDEVVQFVESKLVVAFKYVNKNEMDPFYGESVYKNIMDDKAYDGYEKYTLYGIESTVCQSVVQVLGGTGNDNSSTISAGYTGQTVAVGLTPEVMMNYGLYAHRIYFELPRGIYDPADFDANPSENTSDSLADLSNYAWFDTLGFTLYISEEQDGYRYVGSDMYDVVARVPAADFSFLDYDFDELWARKNFLFLDVTNVAEMDFDFNMKDYYGRYNFSVSKETVYVPATGAKPPQTEPFEGSIPDTRLYVNITSSSDAKDTKYEQIKDSKGLDSLSVSDIYNVLYNNGQPLYFNRVDTHGVINYMSFFQTVFYTRYQDSVLTPEEISSALSREKLMTLKVKVFEKDGSHRAGYYAYDFHYLDDSRVMVSAYRTDNGGTVVTEKVSSFTISNYAFENIVLSVFGILNGEYLDDYNGYVDKK